MSTFECPHCHNEIQASPVRAGGGWGRAARDGWSRLHSGSSTATSKIPPSPTPTTKIVTPTNVRGGFRGAGDDPVVQALVSAGAIGTCMLVVGIGSEWPLRDVALTTVFTLVGTFAVSWFGLLRISQGLLTTIEETFDIDLDGDGHAGTPPVLRIEIESRRGNTKRENYIDSPVSFEVLQQFTGAILKGKSTSEGTWSGSNKPFSRREYRKFRDRLIQDGLAEWKNPKFKRLGFVLTSLGEEAFSQIADAAHPPAP